MLKFFSWHFPNYCNFIILCSENVIFKISDLGILLSLTKIRGFFFSTYDIGTQKMYFLFIESTVGCIHEVNSMGFPCHFAEAHTSIPSWWKTKTKTKKKSLKGKCVECLNIWKWPYFIIWLVVWLGKQLHIKNNLKALFHCVLAFNVIYIL